MNGVYYIGIYIMEISIMHEFIKVMIILYSYMEIKIYQKHFFPSYIISAKEKIKKRVALNYRTAGNDVSDRLDGSTEDSIDTDDDCPVDLMGELLSYSKFLF